MTVLDGHVAPHFGPGQRGRHIQARDTTHRAKSLSEFHDGGIHAVQIAALGLDDPNAVLLPVASALENLESLDFGSRTPRADRYRATRTPLRNDPTLEVFGMELGCRG